MQVCVFDVRRGQVEGQEIDKIIFFHPCDCPIPAQLSLIGLSEGLIGFTKIFSPTVPCEVIKSKQKSHVFYQCESDIWMIMVVENGKDSNDAVRESALRAMLKEIHSLFVMFHGTITSLLQNDPTGDVARSYLHTFVPDYLADYMAGKKARMPSSQDSLTERGTIQMLSLDQETALEVQILQHLMCLNRMQSLVNHLGSWVGGGRIRHMLILYNSFLVSTTLPPDDTVNLYAYANMRLSPTAISHFSASKTSVKAFPSIPNSSSSRLASDNNSRNGSEEDRISHSTMATVNDVLPRPLQQDRWWKDRDGFLVTDAWGVGVKRKSAMVPSVNLLHSEGSMHLCVYQRKLLTILMLIPVCPSEIDSEGSSLLRNQILDKASQKIGKLEERLMKEWGGSNLYHVPGYRYLCIDRDSSVSRPSPPSKIATLSKDSLMALNRLRGEVDVAKRRYEQSNAGEPWDLEVCMRTKNNAWVIARVKGVHELYMVLDRASETLLLTSDAIEKFNRSYCHGIFSSD